MIVSILQLMGFPMGKPVNSRASENAQSQPSMAHIEGITSKVSERAAPIKHPAVSEGHAQAHSARRQEVKKEVKTQTGKATSPAKTAKAAPAPGKPKAAAKTAVKAMPKPNPVAKTKPATQSGTKGAPAALVKPAPKRAGPSKEPQPAAKVVAKGVKTVPVKAVKPTAKVQSKDSVKTTTAKVSKPEVVEAKIKVVAPLAPVKAAPVAPPAVATAPVPARAGRPSSRLAQLTVPSMAQSVASTAAKASFTQTTTAPLIVPPLASAIKKDPKLANNWKLKPVEQLTDAELIAMPDDEYMNDTQMSFFRRKLQALKQDILSNAGETTEHLREDTVVVPDPADRATIEEEHALELRTRDRERKLLKKIEQSIMRIDSGDYGYCDETGEPIGVGRLLARPTANLSLEAQQRRELKQKMFGD